MDKLWVFGLIFMVFLSVSALAQEAQDKTVVFVDAQGSKIGEAVLEESGNGVLIRLDLHDVAPGEHAIHIHEKGACTPVGAEVNDPTQYFTDAGSHLNLHDKKHGLMHAEGAHPGDLPNLIVGQDGRVSSHMFNQHVLLFKREDVDKAALLDQDGAAIIIHETADDYRSQPSGNAGNRIACGAIVAE